MLRGVSIFSLFFIFLNFFLMSFNAHSIANRFEKIAVDGLEFEYRYRGESLDIQVRCRTTGWVGVGFDPIHLMKGANLIIGYVDSEGVHLSDRYGVDQGDHKSDEELGGQNNLQAISGFEKDGWTELHFSISVDSQDPYDVSLYPGQPHTLLLACGGEGRDNFIHKHRRVVHMPWNP